MAGPLPPYPRASKDNHAHMIWHYPGSLGVMNNKMPAAKANAILYHEPNSIRGAEKRMKDGANSCDNDLIVSKKGQGWVAHWDEAMEPWVGFHHQDDPDGKPKWSHKNVSQMETVEVKPLESLYGGYRMHRLEDFIEYKISIGTGASFEQKFHPRLRTYDFWEKAAKFILSHGGSPDQFMAMTLPSPSAATKFLNAAGQAGLMTGILYRGGPSRGDVRFMVQHGRPTWVKCSEPQFKGLVSDEGTKRMGTSAANATWLGCSVHDSSIARAKAAITRAGGNPTLWEKR